MERRLQAVVPRGAPLERVLHWDQGFLNAQRARYDVPLANLGYPFNYVGSFETTNVDRRPFHATDAFFVHGTTGLLMTWADRAAWLRNVSDVWALRGV